MFPSPFGVRVLKSVQTQNFIVAKVQFPSPFGVRVLKYINEDVIIGIVSRFPSPFGVRVLKSGEHGAWEKYSGSFRPLSGFVF